MPSTAAMGGETVGQVLPSHGEKGAHGGKSVRDTLLEVVRNELRAEYEERLVSDARRATEHIDSLILSSLRQLPPYLRDMPARKALFAGKKRQDAQTQTTVYAVQAKKHKSRAE